MLLISEKKRNLCVKKIIYLFFNKTLNLVLNLIYINYFFYIYIFFFRDLVDQIDQNY